MSTARELNENLVGSSMLVLFLTIAYGHLLGRILGWRVSHGRQSAQLTSHYTKAFLLHPVLALEATTLILQVVLFLTSANGFPLEILLVGQAR